MLKHKFFDFKTKKRIEEIQKREDEISLEIKAISERGKSCLETKEFKHYVEKYVGLEQKIINLLIDYTNEWQKHNDSSLEKYGIKVMVLLTRIGALRALIDNIQLDANRGEPRDNA